MKILFAVFIVVVGGALRLAAASDLPVAERPRVILLTDYFKDPDEVQSMIRFLCYANEYEIEGLVATSLAYGDGSVRPEWIVDILGDYGKVQPNLQQHAPAGRPFPTAESLQRVVRGGAPMIRRLVGSVPATEAPNAKEKRAAAADNEVRRMARGRGFAVPYPPGARDTRECEPAENWLRADRISAGARHIIEVVDRPDPRPVWVIVWGGSIDLAQAIWLVRHERTPEAAARFIAKLRVHQSNWQDTGTVWIWNNVPELFFIFTLFARGGLNTEPPEELRNEAWIRRHLLEGHGPLAARYPVVTERGNKLAMKEGDSPTFLYLLAPGLSDPGQPEWGAWGGRRERFDPARNFFVDGRDRHPASQDPMRESYWALARWADAISRDFAARLDWCVKDRASANHPPVVRVNGDGTLRVLRRSVAAGETVSLNAAGSLDPDGPALTYRWSQYVEPGTLRETIRLTGAETEQVSFVAPSVSAPETLHMILEVSDGGEPRLTSYRRVVITINPAAAGK